MVSRTINITCLLFMMHHKFVSITKMAINTAAFSFYLIHQFSILVFTKGQTRRPLTFVNNWITLEHREQTDYKKAVGQWLPVVATSPAPTSAVQLLPRDVFLRCSQSHAISSASNRSLSSSTYFCRSGNNWSAVSKFRLAPVSSPIKAS